MLLKKIQKRMKNSVGYVSELRAAIFVFILAAMGVELYQLFDFGPVSIERNSFIICTILFYLLFCGIGFIINLFEDGKMVVVLSVIVALPLGVLLLKNQHIVVLWALIVATAMRLLFGLVGWSQQLIKYGIFLLAGAAVFLWYFYDSFGNVNAINRLLFAAIIAISLSSIQQILVEKNKGAFPFHFFLLLCLITFVIPVKPEPFDWSRMESLAGKIAVASDNAAYYFSGLYDGGSYSTGYSSLAVSGGRVKKSSKKQLKLTTPQVPYHIYTDVATGKQMKGRKVIYLQGQQGVDNRQLIGFLQFLYNHQVNRSEASVFSQISKLSIEYVYLTTSDEIVPWGVIAMDAPEGELHKKGYKEDTLYLDIDYGSLEFVNLCRQENVDNTPLSYEEMCKYANQTYRLDLSEIIHKQEYEELLADYDLSEYKELPQEDNKLHALATEITKSANTDYDKCKLIEAYLRQYPYTTDAEGGYNEDSTLATVDGMADIAGRFLFDTREGYCVHYTASMVMLLREAGIPARAMSGFRYVYPFEADKEYVVQANCAHLWPEAYIEGVGWLPFEPTSAYYNSEELTWHRGEGVTSADNAALNEALAQIVPAIPSGGDTVKEHVDKRFVITIVAVIILSIVVLIALAIAITILVRYLKYKHASIEERLIIDVENIKQQLVKNTDATLEDRGLLSDYLQLAAEGIRPQVQHSFDLYYQVLYGGKVGTITPEDSASIHELAEIIHTGNS